MNRVPSVVVGLFFAITAADCRQRHGAGTATAPPAAA
jgi:hypothetical protein